MHRARGVPLRLVSKSVRCSGLMRRVLARPGYAGVLAYSLCEALWLAGEGFDDVVVAYPTTDRAALRRLVDDDRLVSTVTIMIDEAAQLDLVGPAALFALPVTRAQLRLSRQPGPGNT